MQQGLGGVLGYHVSHRFQVGNHTGLIVDCHGRHNADVVHRIQYHSQCFEVDAPTNVGRYHYSSSVIHWS